MTLKSSNFSHWSRSQNNFSITFILVSCEERGYYSVGQLSFDCLRAQPLYARRSFGTPCGEKGGNSFLYYATISCQTALMLSPNWILLTTLIQCQAEKWWELSHQLGCLDVAKFSEIKAPENHIKRKENLMKQINLSRSLPLQWIIVQLNDYLLWSGFFIWVSKVIRQLFYFGSCFTTFWDWLSSLIGE